MRGKKLWYKIEIEIRRVGDIWWSKSAHNLSCRHKDWENNECLGT